ncbi:hypothetical protein CBR_g16931 [Chara braunii]|uniref:Uncharacterized protein n=1 Tax=Chara braunii TaxID=69332 RepID=A0A388KU76_CHABU|nr:hypothetical protein CBR_g16931 [Chara braunii]|eukprot:GBG73589.1 hypothetical protein CBR_g16931 [Chara braunii]
MERKKRKEVSAIQGADLALGGVLSNMAAQLKEMKEQMAPGKVMAVGQATNKRRYGGDDEEDKEEEEEESEQTTKAKTTQKKIKNQPTRKQGTDKVQNPQQARTSEAQAPATQLAPWPVVAPMGNKNRADGLSRIKWVQPGEAKKEMSPVDGFLEEDDMQLHVNAWALKVKDDGVQEGRPMWFAPTTFVKDERPNPVKRSSDDTEGRSGGAFQASFWQGTTTGITRVTRNADGMPIYKKGDNLRLFLREFEDHAFGRKWDTPIMLQKVNGVVECQLKIEEITTDCLGWMTFKTEMWTEYGDLRRDEIEEDITFDETNVEDFEESIALCAENKEWNEKEKLEQGEAEIDEKLEGTGKSQRGNDKDGKMEVSIKGLQERVKEKEELLTHGVASHIPEIMKDAQVEKMEKEVESMRVEMSKVKEEQQELKKQVGLLNIALGSKNKEVEKKKVEREKLEREVGKLEGKVNKQEKKMEALRKVSQEGETEMPTKIAEWNDELRFEIRSVTETPHAPG